MRSINLPLSLLVGVTLGVLHPWAVVGTAQAEVLCQNKKGAVFVRAVCKPKETPLDPEALGLKGDKGDPGDPATSPYTFITTSSDTEMDCTSPPCHFEGTALTTCP